MGGYLNLDLESYQEAKLERVFLLAQELFMAFRIRQGALFRIRQEWSSPEKILSPFPGFTVHLLGGSLGRGGASKSV